MRLWVQSLATLSGQGYGIAMGCDAGHRRRSDLVLLWLRPRPAAAAPIQPLAWEFPYAAGTALKRKKKNVSLMQYLGFTYTKNLFAI